MRSAGITSAYRSSPMPCSFWNSKAWPSERGAPAGSHSFAIRCTATMVWALWVANIGYTASVASSRRRAHAR